MNQFTPISALIGGLLIGLATSLLLWLNGRMAGVSGVLGRLLASRSSDTTWRLLFLVGLVVGAGAYVVATGTNVPIRQGVPTSLLVLAGLLTGYGTTMANGCTSGHGVCGLARLSPRSVAAVATFMATAIMTTYVVRHVLGVAT